MWKHRRPGVLTDLHERARGVEQVSGRRNVCTVRFVCLWSSVRWLTVSPSLWEHVPDQLHSRGASLLPQVPSRPLEPPLTAATALCRKRQRARAKSSVLVLGLLSPCSSAVLSGLEGELLCQSALVFHFISLTNQRFLVTCNYVKITLQG